MSNKNKNNNNNNISVSDAWDFSDEIIYSETVIP
jgi:hypothetical protein